MSGPRPKKRAPTGRYHRLNSMPIGLILGAITLVALGTAILITWLEPTRSRLCATSVQRATAQARIEQSPTVSLGAVSVTLEASTAVVLDAFPADRRVGVPGSLAPLVWKSLQQWPQPVIDLARGAHDFAIRSPLPPLVDSPSGNQYVFGGPGQSLNLRLKRSEVGAIYAYVAKTADGNAPVVIFLDRRGAVIFRVISAQHTHDGQLPAHFQETFRYMATLPGVCSAES